VAVNAAPAWTTKREVAGTGLLRFAGRLALLIGRRIATLALWPVCAFYFVARPRERAASKKYLGRVLGREPGVGDVLRHLHCFAAVLLDRVYLMSGHHAGIDVRIHGEEALSQAADEGAGCLLLGAHLGSFEVLRFLGEQRLRVHLAMYEENARQTNAALGAFGADALPVIALGRVDSMLNIEEALSQGGAVGLLADRTFESTGTLAVPFLGDDALFPTGPMRLAVALGRPVYFMAGLYRDGRYDVYFERLADGDRNGAPRARFVEDAVRRYAARLEHHCRLAPYNWFNFHDFWS
jgi:predicted LPLAT superfamily acyltransferase